MTRGIGLYATLLAALAGTIPYPAAAEEEIPSFEAGCIVYTMQRARIPRDAATSQCRARFNWTDVQVSAANQVADSFINMLRYVVALQPVGLTREALDRVYSRLTPEEQAVLGTPGAYQDAANRDLPAILAGHMREAGITREQWDAASGYLVHLAIAERKLRLFPTTIR